MPAPRHRSRSLRRVYVRIPSGKSIIHYKKRKPKIGHCAECGAVLKGVIRELPSKMKKIAKTKKRPERPHPNLCSRCMRRKIISEVRQEVKKNV